MNASGRPGRPHVVVVGAGMAGLGAVRALSHASVTVQLIDAHNYTTFPPLLFQVATCFISPAEVARPIRALLRRSPAATFRMGRAAGVDWPGQRVLLDDGDAPLKSIHAMDGLASKSTLMASQLTPGSAARERSIVAGGPTPKC